MPKKYFFIFIDVRICHDMQFNNDTRSSILVSNIHHYTDVSLLFLCMSVVCMLCGRENLEWIATGEQIKNKSN